MEYRLLAMTLTTAIIFAGRESTPIRKGGESGAGIPRGSNVDDLSASQEVLRAVVVITHAYLEDFVRTLADAFLPLAGEEILNDIPLVGSFGRAEKFQLGKLAQHRTKTVDNVIRESVRAYLERSTFNSSTEIAAFLKKLGFGIPDDQKENLAHIEPS